MRRYPVEHLRQIVPGNLGLKLVEHHERNVPLERELLQVRRAGDVEVVARPLYRVGRLPGLPRRQALADVLQEIPLVRVRLLTGLGDRGDNARVWWEGLEHQIAIDIRPR